jgi:NAD(P)-dependent dehydrogenase (short-subunit alcohol dehydrogenase family)
VVFASGDASNRQDLVQVRDGILVTHGRVDVLVNAAGVNSATAFLDISDEEMERMSPSTSWAWFGPARYLAGIS